MSTSQLSQLPYPSGISSDDDMGPDLHLHQRSIAIPSTTRSLLREYCGKFLILPLLLSPFVTSCTIEQIAAPSQNRATPAQAAGQPQAEPQDPDSVKTRTTLAAPTTETLQTEIPPTEIPPTEISTAGVSETLPQSQQSPQLMSQAASTAANKPANRTTTPTAAQGPLRVGNQTEHPLRIAFLAQGETAPDVASLSSGTPIATEPEAQNSGLPEPFPPEPFHWDFAPDEGGNSGLLLALPEGDLALKDGDVIVAFAQDGSQRYWGPYVVGQTSLPHWNGDRDEWQLLVQP